MRMAADERKQELIDIALRLFLQHGYKNVSVQEILKVANGQNGMFYHHFKSKDDIYNAALKKFINDAASSRISIIQDDKIPFPDRLFKLTKFALEDSSHFTKMFGMPSDSTFVTEALEGFIEALVVPLAKAFIQAKNDGVIPVDSFINEDNAQSAARFMLYGSNGLARIRKNEGADNSDAKDILLFIHEFLRIPFGQN